MMKNRTRISPIYKMVSKELVWSNHKRVQKQAILVKKRLKFWIITMYQRSNSKKYLFRHLKSCLGNNFYNLL